MNTDAPGTSVSSFSDASVGAAGAAGHAADLPGGLQTSQDGYSLRLDPDQYATGPQGPLTFVIEGPDGRAVTAYDVEHEKELHLIVVRRDFGGYHHIHPTRAADGTWSVPLELTPGAWRVLADFAPRGGEPMTLGADLFAPGSDAAAQSPRDDLRTATVDGYTVSARGQRIEIGTDTALPPLRLVLHAVTGGFIFDDQAIRDVRYLVEERRGYDHAGPLWSPGRFRADLTRRAPVTVIASAESWDTVAATNPDEALVMERTRRARLLTVAAPAASR